MIFVNKNNRSFRIYFGIFFLFSACVLVGKHKNNYEIIGKWNLVGTCYNDSSVDYSGADRKLIVEFMSDNSLIEYYKPENRNKIYRIKKRKLIIKDGDKKENWKLLYLSPDSLVIGEYVRSKPSNEHISFSFTKCRE